MPHRRNVRKLALRPALPRRAIVWFPAFPDDAKVETFRAAHDPLASVTRAHVHLVFPFHANLTSVQIASHVRRIVSAWPPLPVTFRDVEGLLDEFVLLMVRERETALTALHDALYTGVLKGFLRSEIPYRPHVTIARAESRETFPAILSAAEQQFGAGRGREWRLVLRELAVVTLHPDGTISHDHTISLNC
jgi:2'-5' RNA ligase